MWSLAYNNTYRYGLADSAADRVRQFTVCGELLEIQFGTIRISASFLTDGVESIFVYTDSHGG